jgi:hypothetical protein
MGYIYVSNPYILGKKPYIGKIAYNCDIESAVLNFSDNKSFIKEL